MKRTRARKRYEAYILENQEFFTLLKSHTFFFEIHNNMPQSYNVDYAIINEYFARVFQICSMEENCRLFPKFIFSAEYERQRKMFIFIDDFVDLLRKFEKSQVAFDEYYTSSIEGILNEKERLLYSSIGQISEKS